MDANLLDHLKSHWRDVRGRTYDLLDVLTEGDLDQRLPFPKSQSIYYQFWCIIGTTSSFADNIATGEWQGWHNPLNKKGFDDIRTHLRLTDDKLFAALEQQDLLQPYANGKTPLSLYLTLVEHEAHHHGQLINFIYAFNLPIPKSWKEKWLGSED